MGQFSKVLQLLIMHTAPQRTLDCGPGLGGLNQVYGPNHPIPMHLYYITNALWKKTSEVSKYNTTSIMNTPTYPQQDTI